MSEFSVDAFHLNFVIYGSAQPAGSKRGFVHKGTGRVVIVDDNKKAKPWKESIAEVAGKLMEGRTLFEGPLSLRVTFFRPRPQGHYGKKGLRASAPKFPITRPDCTKLLRGLEDSLTGVVYRDDSQIVSQFVEKHYTDGPERTEVRVNVKLR